MPQPLILHGIAGRMGRRVLSLARARREQWSVVAGVDRAGASRQDREEEFPAVFDSLAEALSAGGAVPGAIVIDFSAPAAVVELAGECAAAGLALVSGTTGLSEAQHAALKSAAASVPVVWAPNMSPGVNLLYRLVELAARALPEADIEVVEAHHRHKVDAPSGTAAQLAARATAARGGGALRHGREGLTPGGRPRGEIGVHSLRLGEVIGDHEIYLGLEHEVVRLGHRALSRDAFAGGALAAARFAASAAPGLYGMHDVLNLGSL